MSEAAGGEIPQRIRDGLDFGDFSKVNIAAEQERSIEIFESEMVICCGSVAITNGAASNSSTATSIARTKSITKPALTMFTFMPLASPFGCMDLYRLRLDRERSVELRWSVVIL